MITRLIVEGPDCSGKSTLVERLKNTLKWDSKSLHHKPGNQFERYLREYALNDKTIFDRAHYSELVYGTLWRGGNPFTQEELSALNKVSIINTLVLFACPPTKTLQERYLARDYDQQISLTELETSRQLFCEVMSSVPHLLYESRDYEELESLLNRVRSQV